MKRLQWVAIFLLLLSGCGNAFESKPVTVVFVCQYGYGKSLVAARHFEQKAAASGLNVQVLARGLTPTSTVAPAMVTALANDGFDVSQFQPSALTAADIELADRIVSFGVDVPGAVAITTRVDDVPALSQDYVAGRDRINQILDRLLIELMAERQLIETD
ncbi:hypothetical protein HPT27_02345 [Permianibacter sp. IMCC34836]|uniref:arsenate reductase/protein-tyrosine-phosphatase family protein n=1 Tax=Permianibacter fluminis TaxID=2738515 RepID=UPI001553C83A|nr:hypothetical protein [Permianibacter fluminis]NQD35844.1 hypothetical protein [Permianibacter fluminis]